MSDEVAGPGTRARPAGYRAGVEAILGLGIKGGSLVVDPCIPAAWPGFEMTLRYRGATYDISIRNPDGVSRGVIAAQLDGEPEPLLLGKARLPLSVDNGTHTITVTLGVVTMGRVVAA